jgi:hypothetical protein
VPFDLKKALGATAIVLTLTAGSASAQMMTEGWDTNGDGIGQDEFNTGYGESGVYDRWDADASGDISEDEFSQGIFNSYDENEDGTWDENETGMFEDDAGEQGFWDW